MLRICPSCKTMLGEYNHYFCSGCGFVLPGEFVVGESGYVRRLRMYEWATPLENSESKEKFKSFASLLKNKKLLVGLGTGLLGVLIIAYVGMSSAAPSKKTSLPKTSSVVVKVPPSPSYTHVITSSMVAKSSNHVPEELLKFIPEDVDFVFSFSDSSAVGDVINGFDSGYSSLIVALKPNIVPEGILFVKSSNFGVVTKVKSSEFVISPDTLKLAPWVSIKREENFIVFTTTSELAESSVLAFKGMERNISQNSKFALVKTKLPQQGKFFAMFLTSDGSKYVQSLKTKKIPSELLDIVNKFSASGFEDAIIK